MGVKREIMKKTWLLFFVPFLFTSCGGEPLLSQSSSMVKEDVLSLFQSILDLYQEGQAFRFEGNRISSSSKEIDSSLVQEERTEVSISYLGICEETEWGRGEIEGTYELYQDGVNLSRTLDVEEIHHDKTSYVSGSDLLRDDETEAYRAVTSSYYISSEGIARYVSFSASSYIEEMEELGEVTYQDNRDDSYLIFLSQSSLSPIEGVEVTGLAYQITLDKKANSVEYQRVLMGRSSSEELLHLAESWTLSPSFSSPAKPTEEELSAYEEEATDSSYLSSSYIL